MNDITAQNEALIRAYRLTFGSQTGQEVLRDLGRFCFAAGSPFVPDQNETIRNVGRNEVWRRICDYSHFTVEEIYALRRGVPIQQGDDDGGR